MKTTISQAIEGYLDNLALARSKHTARSYQNGLHQFVRVLEDHGFEPEKDSIKKLNEDAIAWFAGALKDYAPATEQLYLTAAAGFYKYLAAEKLSAVNLPRLRMLISQRSRRPGKRLPQFPREDIETVLEHAKSLAFASVDDRRGRLRNYRDMAFLLTLADTGLRVHEACQLRRGDLDWNEGKAIIIGKGNRQDVVRFSIRSLEALRDYLNRRGELDGATGRSMASLPLFARHDKRVGKQIKPISTRTGHNIVTQRVDEALGPGSSSAITPHSFRHYFVTTVLRGSGNLKLAQELARHRSISVTQRYAHLSDDELDRGYYEIFD
jgi:integrase/recombinase XerC